MNTNRLAASLIAASLLAPESPARAMTLQTVEMTCPYDGTSFQFIAQGSGTSAGQSLDFMLLGPIDSPWPIAVCPTNGFVFIKQKYEPEELERLRPIVLSPEYQALKDETPYYRAAWIMERSGEARADVSFYLLQATWEAGWEAMAERYKAQVKATPPGAREPHPDIPALFAAGTLSERYRRYATELLARLPADISAASPRSGQFKMVQGELLRRLGRFDEADAYFKALEADYGAGSGETNYVAFQRELVARRDLGIHPMRAAPRR